MAGFPNASVIKNPLANPGATGHVGFIPGLGRSPGEETATHASILAGYSHGQRSLESYRPWGPKESDTTEHTHTDKAESCSQADDSLAKGTLR